MKKFLITLDLTLSGDFEIEAENEQEAKEQIMHKYFDNYMKANMHELSREIYQIEVL
jgi:hypothetical protein